MCFNCKDMRSTQRQYTRTRAQAACPRSGTTVALCGPCWLCFVCLFVCLIYLWCFNVLHIVMPSRVSSLEETSHDKQQSVECDLRSGCSRFVQATCLAPLLVTWLQFLLLPQDRLLRIESQHLLMWPWWGWSVAVVNTSPDRLSQFPFNQTIRLLYLDCVKY